MATRIDVRCSAQMS